MKDPKMPDDQYITLADQRPGRDKMPPLEGVARYWLQHPKFPRYLGNMIGMGEPFCARCELLVPVEDGIGAWARAGKYIERAHLVDRMYGGLDGPQNLLPLCWRCHRKMPAFGPGQEEEALVWVTSYVATQNRMEKSINFALGCMEFEGLTRHELDDVERTCMLTVLEQLDKQYLDKQVAS